MRPITFTLTNGQSQIVVLDKFLTPFQVAVDAVVNGAATYTVQASNDDPFSGSNPTNFVAGGGTSGVNLPPAASTTSLQGTVTNPVRQLFAQVTAGGGSVTFRVIQAGSLG